MIELLVDPAQFELRAGRLIASRIENTVLATVLRGILDGRYADVPSRFAVEPPTLRLPPRPAPGALRAPAPDEIERYVAWECAFAGEADPHAGPEVAARHARERIAAGRGFVWDDGGPVSLLGHTPVVAGVPRLGPVYTPPELRGRGYASSAVHALTARLLDAGATRVVLFTDLANPTSNRIYADVGYRRVGDWEVYALRSDRTASA